MWYELQSLETYGYFKVSFQSLPYTNIFKLYYICFVNQRWNLFFSCGQVEEYLHKNRINRILKDLSHLSLKRNIYIHRYIYLWEIFKPQRKYFFFIFVEKENRGTGSEKENSTIQHFTAQSRQSPHLWTKTPQRKTAPRGVQTIHTHKSPW